MPQKFVRAPKQKRTAALTSVSDLVKSFDRYKQLSLSPQLVRYTRLGSVPDSESVVRPEASGRSTAASNLFYRVPIKPRMPIGSLKQAVAEVSQAAKDLVSSGQVRVKSPVPGPSGLCAVPKVPLTDPPSSGGALVDIGDQAVSDLMDTAGLESSLDWTEDDAKSVLYTEQGATDNLPHHLQLQGQIPFTPTFTEEEAAALSLIHI